MQTHFKPVLCTAFALIATTSLSDASTPLSGTHSRPEVRVLCNAAGGSYYMNLDGYGCIKANCDGAGGSCSVTCKNDGTCDGDTPSMVRGERVPDIARDLNGTLNPNAAKP